MGKKSASTGSKARSAAYKALNKCMVNAKAKVSRHLKKHPNDEQAQAALSVVGSKNFRTKPKNKNGWATEALRSSLVYVPYLTAKGSPIFIKVSDQINTMIHSHGQSIPNTKSNLRAMAQLLRFTSKSAFHPIPVTEVHKVRGGSEVAVVVMKHDSKLSNFKG